MRIGSLFSGIGGLELGLEMSGLGHTVWQVEQSQFCRDILAKHWPRAERFEDVKTVGSATLSPVDIICGGFPCQDVSSAGKGAGLAGSRSGLWFEFARIIGEVRPEWVVIENVASGATRWVDPVMAGLAEQGYQAVPFPLSARDVGAPHLRRRIFVVGHTDCRGESTQPGHGEMAGLQGNAGSVADPDREQLREQQGWCGRTDGQDAREPGDHGAKGEAPDAESSCQFWEQGPPVPVVCGVDDGPASWVDRRERLRALGNAVVPQCAEVIGHVILELCRG